MDTNPSYFEAVRVGGGLGSSGLDIDSSGNLSTDGVMVAAGLDSTPVGATTPAAGTFTNLTGTGVLTMGSGPTVLTNANGTIKGVALEATIAGAGLSFSGGVLSHSTANGYGHIPASGAANQVLVYASAGAAAWSNNLSLPGTLNVVGAATVATLTASGNLLAGGPTTTATRELRLRTAAGYGKFLAGYVGDNARWIIQLGTNHAESGSDAGSNFYVSAYSDAGAYIDAPLTIARASNGAITLARPVAVSGTNNLTVGGDVAVNGGDLTSTATTFNLLNATVTTLNLGGAADINLSASNKTVTAAGSMKAADYKLSALNTAPANAGDTGTAGEIRIDASAIYVCVAANTWKKVAIATW